METKKETGKLEAINNFSGDKNGKSWTRYEIHLNGLKYSTFESKLIKDIKVGDMIELDLEKPDKYWQIKDLIKIQESVGNSEPDVKPTYLENNTLRTVHFVLSGLSDDECMRALNQASEANGNSSKPYESGVFATQSHYVDGKWNIIIFVRK